MQHRAKKPNQLCRRITGILLSLAMLTSACIPATMALEDPPAAPDLAVTDFVATAESQQTSAESAASEQPPANSQPQNVVPDAGTVSDTEAVSDTEGTSDVPAPSDDTPAPESEEEAPLALTPYATSDGFTISCYNSYYSYFPSVELDVHYVDASGNSLTGVSGLYTGDVERYFSSSNPLTLTLDSTYYPELDGYEKVGIAYDSYNGTSLGTTQTKLRFSRSGNYNYKYSLSYLLNAAGSYKSLLSSQSSIEKDIYLVYRQVSTTPANIEVHHVTGGVTQAQVDTYSAADLLAANNGAGVSCDLLANSNRFVKTFGDYEYIAAFADTNATGIFKSLTVNPDGSVSYVKYGSNQTGTVNNGQSLQLYLFYGRNADAASGPDTGTTQTSSTKTVTDNKDGTYTTTISSYADADINFTESNYDIIILLDQSKGMQSQRSSIISNLNSFVSGLGSGNRVALLGYGRINNPGENSSLQENHYHTGYYTSSGSFVSNSLSWNEATNVGDNTTAVPSCSGNIGDVFMSAANAANVTTSSNIEDFDSGAARLDAGLVLSDYVINHRTNPTNEVVVVVFSSTTPYRNGEGSSFYRSAAVIHQGQVIRNESALVYSIGSYQSSLDASQFPWDNAYNFKATLSSFSDFQSIENLKAVFASIISMSGSTQAISVNDGITPSFALQSGGYTVRTYPFTGYTNGAPQFSGTPSAEKTYSAAPSGDEIQYDGVLACIPNETSYDKLLQSTDYKHLAVQGSKTVITFTTGVIDGFMGGNQVPTNTASSGYTVGRIHTDYPVPTVDLPLQASITAQDATIYLGNSAPLSSLLQGGLLHYTQNGVSYQVDGINNAYVDLTYTVQAGAQTYTCTIPAGTTTAVWDQSLGNVSPTDCTDYAILCQVSPTKTGSMSAIHQAQSATVHVSKPVITCRDQTIFLGETCSLIGSYDVQWATAHSNAPAAMGQQPTVTVTLADGSIAQTLSPRQDTNYRLAYTISGQQTLTDTGATVVPDTTTEHDHCYLPSSDARDHDFTVHVQAGSITIGKQLQAYNSAWGDDATFFFKVENADTGAVYYRSLNTSTAGTFTVGIIEGLPKGTYLVTELNTVGYTCDDTLFRFHIGRSAGESATGSATFRNEAADADNTVGDTAVQGNTLTYVPGRGWIVTGQSNSNPT